MNISLAWLNRLLAPGGLTADVVEHALTFQSFPIEEVVHQPTGDVVLDVEVTSNRGDCLSHVGLARELAACPTLRPRQQLTIPEPAEPRHEGRVGEGVTLENHTPEVCPLFTVRLIRGVKVGPSPKWLVDLLEAVGQRSINNVVDVTNWLTLEHGNPSHVFDLASLASDTLVVRWAHDKERLKTLDGKERVLKADELVVADGERAQSLAGVIGGADSEVTSETRDVVLEVACWDPATVRRAARRHAVRTDASYRFERGVDPRTLEEASRRAAHLICEIAGGTLCEGMLAEGRELPAGHVIELRPERVRSLIGIHIEDEEIADLLRGHDVRVERDGQVLQCHIPAFRIDLEREVDLIEEIARTKGFDHVPVLDRLPIVVAHPQESERAFREIGHLLTGLGFYEAVTFSFLTPELAGWFVPEGTKVVEVDDERRGAEPALRPSVLPSLLACRKANRDSGGATPGGVRLFETAAVYAESAEDGRVLEHRTLAMVLDVPGQGRKVKAEHVQEGLRLARGAIETLARAMAGAAARVEVERATPAARAWDPGTFGSVKIDGRIVGSLGTFAPDLLAKFDLDRPLVGVELVLDPLVEMYPPKASVHALPAFPGIERDLSLVVEEGIAWGQVASLVEELSLDRLEGFEFVGTFRGQQVGAGKKSVTLRLRFRDAERTLRHEEVDPQVESLVAKAGAALGAELRG